MLRDWKEIEVGMLIIYTRCDKWDGVGLKKQ